MEIAAAPVSLQSPRLDRPGDMTILPKSLTTTDRPRYADLIDPDNLDKEQRCLAEAVYFEARSESVEAGGRRPGGAEPGEERPLSVLEHLRRGLPEPPPPSRLPVHLRLRRQGPGIRDTESWERAKQVASAVLEGKTYLADVAGDPLPC